MTAIHSVDRPPERSTDSEQLTIPHGTRASLSGFLDIHPDTRCALQQRLQEYPEYRTWLRMFARDLLAALEG